MSGSDFRMTLQNRFNDIQKTADKDTDPVEHSQISAHTELSNTHVGKTWRRNPCEVAGNAISLAVECSDARTASSIQSKRLENRSPADILQ